MASDSQFTDVAPLLVFHQCMDKEWTSWGRESAREFAQQGFAVIRVKSRPWKDLKTTSPEAFRNPYRETENEQQMICTIVMRDITCPMVQKVVQQMHEGALPSDLRKWNPIDWELELPPGDRPCTPRLDVVAVTEASALLAPGVTPQIFRALYRSYSHRLVWAGFNATARGTGSKLLLGEPADFALLKMVFDCLRVWHIDQMYKSFQNDYFTVVDSKLDILVGYRDHVSACCNRHDKADNMMGCKFLPKPCITYQRKAGKKIQRPDSAALFIISSLRNFDRCRAPQSDEDTVALRMWSYVLDCDEEVRCKSPEIEKHREDMRKLAISKRSKRQAAAALKAQAKGCEDNELKETLDQMLLTGEPLPVPLAEDTKSHSVLLHIKNEGMVLQDIPEGHILAMCHRGLCVTTRDGASDSILSCSFHSRKEFQCLWQAKAHFVSFGFHRKEEQEQKLVDYEDGAEDEQQKPQDSQSLGWMRQGTKDLQRMGWNPGEGLGRKSQGPKVFRYPGREDSADRSECTLMPQRCSAGAGPGPHALVCFLPGEVLEPSSTTSQADDDSAAGDGDAALPSQPPPLPPISMPIDIKADDESDAGDGDAALPSQPPPLAPPSMPIDINEIDAFAFALLYIQWLAFGNFNNSIVQDALLETWPERVCQLQDHCRRCVRDHPDLSAAIDDILQYMPKEWKNYQDHYIPDLKRLIRKVWIAAFQGRGFISEDFQVQLKWYYALNRYAVENSLLCKIQIQKHRLVFQAQGRLKTTRYKNVSGKRRKQDIEMRDEILSCDKKRTR